MQVEQRDTKTYTVESGSVHPIMIFPVQGERLVIDLPNGSVKYENGVMRLILEPNVPMTVWERTNT